MDKEAKPVISAMQRVKERKVGGKRVLTGKLFGRKIALIVCGVGKVNAACGAQIAIDKFKAEKVVNVGVADFLKRKVF